jgi:hypothetical protein
MPQQREPMEEHARPTAPARASGARIDAGYHRSERGDAGAGSLRVPPGVDGSGAALNPAGSWLPRMPASKPALVLRRDLEGHQQGA